MKSYRARVHGVSRANGFTDVYEVILDVPDIAQSYVSNLVCLRLMVGPELVDTYKRLYMTEEWFQITLPG